MTSETWAFIQSALLYVYEPVIGYWLVAVVFSGVLIPLYMLMLSLSRWLDRVGSLI